MLQMEKSFGEPQFLAEMRVGSICLLVYAAFLRIGEIRALRCCNITFRVDSMEVYIAQTKTDHLRETCPVKMLRKYVILGEIDTFLKSVCTGQLQ